VLIQFPGQPGASNRPPETADTHSHGGTPNTPNRAATAVTAAPIAANASAHTPPAGAGITGSAATARSNTVNSRRTASTRPPNRRNQPRTVSTGRPNTTAIRRHPTPTALADNALPITTTRSARRSSNPTGSNTCVTPQPVHRARRGRTRTGPAGPRTDRVRAYPHPTNTPEQPGHTNRPATNRRSTAAVSPPTVTNDASVRHPRPSRGTPAREGGRAVPYHDIPTLPPNTNKGNHPVVALNPCSPSTPPAYPQILILNAVEHTK
jgi:hypothetical protein